VSIRSSETQASGEAQRRVETKDVYIELLEQKLLAILARSRPSPLAGEVAKVHLLRTARQYEEFNKAIGPLTLAKLQTAVAALNLAEMSDAPPPPAPSGDDGDGEDRALTLERGPGRELRRLTTPV